jgi:CheY-like chemotaxis protein
MGGQVGVARILVADDEAAVRRFVRTVLEGSGYQVIEAANGEQALKRVLAERVDLAILDLVMPNQEGIETIQNLRREARNTAIIAISGAFNGQFLRTAQLLGADAALNKPVSPDLLLAKVAEVLKLRTKAGPE